MGNFTLNPSMLPRRAQAGLLTGGTVSPRTITAQFIYDGTTGSLTYEQAFQKLLGLLDPTSDKPRTLTGTLNDGTLVQCDAIVLNPNSQAGEAEVNVLPITFYTTDPFWKKTTSTDLTVAMATDTVIPLLNYGQARTFPKFSLSWSVQRASDSATVGWKERKQLTITNNTLEDWTDQPICIDLGDTAALVTGSKAQADGDDIRVICYGQSFARTLTNMNTKRTLCHVLISCKSGGSITLDVVYKNASATAPTDLSTRTGTGKSYTAQDLEGTSGTASAGAGSTITIGGAHETDRWANGFIQITGGTGSGQKRRILSNTSTVITVNRAWNTNPDATSTFVIWKSGIFIDGGKVVARTANTMQDTAHTTKWGVNQLEGATVVFTSGSASPATMTVSTNTTDTLTFTGSFSVQPAVADTYTIERYGVYNYVVNVNINNTTHRQLYRINRLYSQPGVIWPGRLTPAGWGPDTYLDNTDDFAQFRPYDVGSGGGHTSNYQSGLRPRRRVAQKAQYQDEGSGDGMSTYTPFGLQGVYFDYSVKNTGGYFKAVMAYKEPGGEDWADIVTYTTAQAALTNIAAQYVDLDAVNNPTRLGMFILPSDGVVVPTTVATSEEGEVRFYQSLIMYLDLSAFGGLSSSIYSLGAEADVYDMSQVLRLSGSDETNKLPPYDRIVIGGTGHKVFLKSTENLVIQTDPATNRPAAAVYVTSTGVLQYRCPWAIRVYRHEANIDGTDTALVSREFMPLKPFYPLISNNSFATNLTGWQLSATTGGVTVAWSRDAAVGYDTDSASLKGVVSVAPVGAWSTTYTMTAATYFAGLVNALYETGVFVRTTSTSLQAEISAYLSDGVTLYNDVSATFTFPATGNWYPIGVGRNAPDGSGVTSTITGQVFLTIRGTGAAALGTVYFDLVTSGGTNLYVSETAMGTISMVTTITPGYHG